MDQNPNGGAQSSPNITSPTPHPSPSPTQPHSNVLVFETPPKKRFSLNFSRFRKPLFTIIPLLLLTGLIFAAISISNYINKESTKKTSTDSTQPAVLLSEEIDETPLIKANFKISGASAAFISTEKVSGHLNPPQILDKPESDVDIYIFKVEVTDPTGKIIYYSWRDYPIIKLPDNTFNIGVIVPHQKDAILRLYDQNETQISLVKFE